MLKEILQQLHTNQWAAVMAIGGSLITTGLLVYLLTKINSSPDDTAFVFQLFFLLLQRPLFCGATALAIMPFVLYNPLVVPVSNLLAHSFWYPFAKLSYGAYLSHCVFMMYRLFNAERGIWACEFDAFMYFLAYLTLSFIFSLLVTLFVEMPVLNCYKVFVLGQKVHIEHLYDSPVTNRKIPKPEIGRKYDLLISKDSNSNSTGSDGAETLDLANAETLTIKIEDKQHSIIPQKPKNRTFVEPKRLNN
jgi:hypothetical protein